MIYSTKKILQIAVITFCISSIIECANKPTVRVKNQQNASKKEPSKKKINQKSPEQAKKQSVRRNTQMKKKSVIKRFAKKVYRSNLVRGTVVTGFLVSGFVLLCHQGLVPGFSPMPNDLTGLGKSLQICGSWLLNGSEPEIEEKKEQAAEVELTADQRNKKVAKEVDISDYVLDENGNINTKFDEAVQPIITQKKVVLGLIGGAFLTSAVVLICQICKNP